ncbi:MAG: DNA polymerase III subunit gamma/tau [Nitrospirota bacterium]|nr:DNA polymerase III subunit gamma/tau [Nitrospirota bacterium]MDE3226842.1 DNA polymerase III subunit gamma/tau [Nitrospirota bacterium]MDE3242614.1 DNA polymerase III subunit gamma/tau [Nitrospirota bacterium]
MDYQVSARKYRPGTFESVIGQPHVVQTLVNAIATKRIAHAFLFSGTRGVGKTTVARILAKALNCEQGPTGTPCETCANCQEITQGTSVDVVEIDGASNTSVDDVREIRENVKFAPFRGHYRVYIIDEVHMLSNSAFNALLKTLEEPPAHVVFIFATTEIHKIPATILSRCQHYNFRRISKAEIIQRLKHVADQEGLTIEARSLAALARASEGSMRDALSLLDQAVAFGGKALQHRDLEALLGSVPQELVRAMVAAIRAQDSPAAVRVVAQLLDQGHDLRAYCGELVEHLRNLLVASIVPAGQGPHAFHGLIDLSEEDIAQIIAEAGAFRAEQLQELFKIFSQTEDTLRLSSHPRFALEVAAVRAASLSADGTAPAAAVAASAPAARPVVPAKPAGPSSAGPAQPARAAQPSVSPSRPGPDSGGASVAPRQPAPAIPAKPLGTVPAKGAPPSPASPHVAKPIGAGRPPNVPPQKPAERSGERSAPAKPAPTAAPSTAPPIRINWEHLLERIEQEHPSIAPFLAQGTLVGTDRESVTMGYQKGSTAFARINTEATRNLVAGLCSELVGRKVRVSVIELAEGQTQAPSMAQTRLAKEREQKQALLERTKAHPLVKQALATFGGELVEVREVTPQKETEA